MKNPMASQIYADYFPIRKLRITAFLSIFAFYLYAVSDAFAVNATCSMVLGESGSSKTVSITIAPGASQTFATIGGAWSFVRSNTGPCHFTLYNSANKKGKHVTYGSNISERVRVGTDGFINKSSGGGDTWRARSLEIRYPNISPVEACSIQVGGNGISMDVYDSIPDLPLSAFVRTTKGRNCQYTLHSGDSYNGERYKYAFPGIDSDFRVGYNVRSIKISSWTQTECPIQENTGSPTIPLGRCLPVATPPIISGNQDVDEDGLDDRIEDWVARTFSPIFIFDSQQAPKNNPEAPKLLYQVLPLDANHNKLRLQGALLWTEDLGYGPSSDCGNSHHGDYSGLTIEVTRTVTASGVVYYSPVLVDLWHHAHWENGKPWNTSWSEGKGHNRGFRFIGTHPAVFISAHKHHTYTDTGWNHQDSPYSDYGCNDDVDGAGRELYASYFNVGNKAHRFINDFSTVDLNFYNYNFWTNDKEFCGNWPLINFNCSGTVLKEKPFTD